MRNLVKRWLSPLPQASYISSIAEEGGRLSEALLTPELPLPDVGVVETYRRMSVVLPALHFGVGVANNLQARYMHAA